MNLGASPVLVSNNVLNASFLSNVSALFSKRKLALIFLHN